MTPEAVKNAELAILQQPTAQTNAQVAEASLIFSVPCNSGKNLPPRPSRPDMLKIVRSDLNVGELQGRGSVGGIALSVTINDDGSVSNVGTIAQTGYPQVNAAAIAIAKKWRFVPATAEGKPIVCHATAFMNFDSLLVLKPTVAVIVSGPQTDIWLPLELPSLVALPKDKVPTASLTVETLDDVLNALRARLQTPGLSERDRQSCERQISSLENEKKALASKLGPDDTIWFATDSNIPLTFVMAGRNNKVHSIRVTVPVVNYSRQENDRVFQILSDLFRRIYPNWTDAESWPGESLKKAWNATALVSGAMTSSREGLVPRMNMEGITSATFGVPPDIVVYTVTVRDVCIPSASEPDIFQRVIC